MEHATKKAVLSIGGVGAWFALTALGVKMGDWPLVPVIVGGGILWAASVGAAYWKDIRRYRPQSPLLLRSPIRSVNTPGRDAPAVIAESRTRILFGFACPVPIADAIDSLKASDALGFFVKESPALAIGVVATTYENRNLAVSSPEEDEYKYRLLIDTRLVQNVNHLIGTSGIQSVDLWMLTDHGLAVARWLGARGLGEETSAPATTTVLGRECPSGIANAVRFLLKVHHLDLFEETAPALRDGVKIESTTRGGRTRYHVDESTRSAINAWHAIATLVSVERRESPRVSHPSADTERTFVLATLNPLGESVAAWLLQRPEATGPDSDTEERIQRLRAHPLALESYLRANGRVLANGELNIGRRDTADGTLDLWMEPDAYAVVLQLKNMDLIRVHQVPSPLDGGGLIDVPVLTDEGQRVVDWL